MNRSTRILVAGLGVAGLAVVATGCGTWIPTPTDTRSVEVSDDVHGVRLDSWGDLTVQVGDEPGLEITAGVLALDRIRVSEAGGILSIGMDGPALVAPGRLNFILTVTDLDDIELRGAGDIRAEFDDADDVSLTVSGAGDITAGGIDARTVSVEVSGAGDISVSGTADRAEARVGGMGSADLSRLQTRDAWAEVSGVGDIRVHATRAVEGFIRGAGDIRVSGGADVTGHRDGVGDIIEG